MPSSSGPDIVQTGLVLSLDAADRNSYVSGSTTWYNLAGNNNGTLINGPMFSSNYRGTFVLDNTNEFFTISGVPTGTTYSAFLWFFYDGQTQFAIKGHRTFFATSTFRYQWDDNFSTTNAYGPFIDFNAASGGGTSYNIFGSNTPQTPSTLFNRWHQVGFTSDGTTLKNYFDGVQIASNVTLTKLFSTDGNLRIAYDGISGIGSADWFFETGGLNYIGPFAIYDRPLSQQEILQNYNALKSRFRL